MEIQNPITEIASEIAETRRAVAPHLHRNLKIRLGIYLAVALLVGGFVIYNAYVDDIPGTYPAAGVGIGLIMGFIASRIHKIRWDGTASKAIVKMDAFGALILVLYFAFEVFRGKIVGQFVDEADVTVTSFSILAGIMYGRVLGIRGSVKRLLEEKDLV